jgi:hypothetical protein
MTSSGSRQEAHDALVIAYASPAGSTRRSAMPTLVARGSRRATCRPANRRRTCGRFKRTPLARELKPKRIALMPIARAAWLRGGDQYARESTQPVGTCRKGDS